MRTLSLRLILVGLALFAGTLGSQLPAQERLSLQDRQTGPVRAIYPSPDGKLLAWLSQEGGLRLWDRQTGKQLFSLDGQGITEVTFTPDGQKLAIHGGGAVRLWDRSTPVPAVVPIRNERTFLSPDGSLAALAGFNGELRLYDLIRRKEHAALQEAAQGVSAVAVAPDGKTLAAATRFGMIHLWDLAARKRRELGSAENRVSRLQFLDGGKVLAVATPLGTSLWDLDTGKSRRFSVPTPHPLTEAPGGTLLAAQMGAVPFDVKIWEARTGKQVLTLRASPDRFLASMAFLAGGKVLATQSQAGEVKLWDVADGSPTRGKERAALHEAAVAVSALAVDPAGKTVAAGHEDGSVKRWDLETGKPLAPVAGHKSKITAVRWSADGKALVTVTGPLAPDGRFAPKPPGAEIKVWDTRTGQERTSFTQAAGLALGPEGTKVAVIDITGKIQLWDPALADGPATVPASRARPAPLAFSAGNRYLTTFQVDLDSIVWDVANRTEAHTLPKTYEPTLTPDGKFLAGYDSIGREYGVWEVLAKPGKGEPGPLKERGRIKTPFSILWALSPDGKVLVAGSGGTVQVFDVAGGKAVAKLSAVVPVGGPPAASALPLRFTPDSKFFAVVQAANPPQGSPLPSAEARLYESATGRLWCQLSGPKEPIRDLIVSPTGTALVALTAPSPLPLSPSQGERGRGEGAAFLWDLRALTPPKGDKAPERKALAHVPSAQAAAFTPDGKGVLLGGSSGGLGVWDVEEGKQRPGGGLQQAGTRVTAVAAGSDGRTLLTATADGVIRVFDADPARETFGTEQTTLEGETRLVTSLRPSADGKWLAAGLFDGQIELWQPGSEDDPKLLRGHTTRIELLEFAADGKRLLAHAADGTAKWWDVSKGEELAAAQARVPVPVKGVVDISTAVGGMVLAQGVADGQLRTWSADAPAGVTLQQSAPLVESVVFAPDGSALASVSPTGQVRVWNAKAGTERASFVADRLRPNLVLFSADGKVLLTRGQDGVKVWDAVQGRSRLTLPLTAAAQDNLRLSPDGKALLLGGVNSAPQLWDVAASKEISLPGSTTGASAVALSPSGRTLAAVCLDGTLRLWDLDSGLGKTIPTGHAGAVNQLLFSPDGRLLATAGTADPRVRLWDMASGELLAILTGHNGRVGLLVFAPDGKALATDAADNTGRLWDVDLNSPTFGKTRAVLADLKARIAVMTFSADSKLLAALSEPGTISVWDVAAGKRIALLPGHTGHITEMAFTGGGELLARTDSGEVRAWDPRASRLTSVPGPKASLPVRSLDLSADGKVLVAGYDAGLVKVWDLVKGGEPRELTIGAQVPALLRVSSEDRSSLPKGPAASTPRRLLLTFDRTSKTSPLRLWNLATGKEHAVLEGQETGARAATFSPDGKLLAVVTDTKLFVWATTGGAPRAILEAGGRPLYSPAFSPNGKLLTASGGRPQVEEKEVRLWDTGSAGPDFGKELLRLDGVYTWNGPFSPDGKLLAVSLPPTAEVRLIDLDPGSPSYLQPLKTLPDTGALLFASNGQTLFCRRRDGTIQVWNTNRKSADFGKEQPALGKQARVSFGGLSADGKRLFTRTQDGEVVCWDIAGRRELGRWQTPSLFAHLLRGNVMAGATPGGALHLWRLPAGKSGEALATPQALQAPAGKPLRFEASPDGQAVAIAMQDGSIRLARPGGKYVDLIGGTESVTLLAFSADGRLLVSAAPAPQGPARKLGEARVWDVATGTLRRTLEGAPADPRSLSLSADGQTLLMWNLNGMARLWDTSTGKPRAPLAEALSANSQALVTRDGKRVVLRNSASNALSVWESATSRPLMRLLQPTGFVSATAFAPNGRLIALARMKDTTVSLVDVATGKEVKVLPGPGGVVGTPLFAPDGKLLALGSASGVTVCDVATGAVRLRLQAATGALAFLPGGAGKAHEVLAVGGQDGSLDLYDLTRGERLATVQKPGIPVQEAALSADGGTLLTLSGSGSNRIATVWDAAGGNPRYQLNNVWAAALAPDGKALAVWQNGGQLKLFDVRKGKPTAELGSFLIQSGTGILTFAQGGQGLLLRRTSSGDGWYYNLGKRQAVRLEGLKAGGALTPDGRLVAAVGEDSVKLLSTTDGKEVGAVAGSGLAVFAPDGKYLATRGPGKTVKVWDVSARAEHVTLGEHAGQIHFIQFTRDGKTLATGGPYESVLRLWDTATGRERAALPVPGGVTALVFDPQGAILATPLNDGTVRLWDVASGRECARLRSPVVGGTWNVSALAYSGDGKTLVLAYGNGALRLWGAEVARQGPVLQGHGGSVQAVAVAPDGKTVATAGSDRTVRLWNEQGKLTATLRGHTGLVLAVAFSPDGKTLASASADRTIRLWSVADRAERATLTGHTDAVWAVAFAPDGKALASGGADRTVRLWSLITDKGQESYGKHLRTLEGAEGEVFALAFHSGGWLAAGEGELFTAKAGVARLWDVTAGKELAVLRGHSGAVRCLAFAPDGKTLATGSTDRTVKLWDTSRGAGGSTCRATLEGHIQPVNGVAFTPDGARVASATGNPAAPLEAGELRFWDARAGGLMSPLAGHRSGLSCLAVGPGGSFVAGSFDESAPWWAGK
ncbi:MAG: hypothetical protein L0Z62_30575 [Gemmataceae bacterium]|nr:hypothetical protein [Gemmataceae bacterium]